MKLEGVAEAPMVPLLVSAGHAGPRRRKGQRQARRLKLPASLVRIQRMAKAILKAASIDELMHRLKSFAPEYVLAKIAFVQDTMKEHFTVGNFAAFSRLSLSEGADFLESDASKKLSREAHLALKLAFDAFARCNARFFSAVKAKALPQEFGLHLQNYVGCVIALELATNALALYLAGEARPRHKHLPNTLAGLCQAWGDEITVHATRLGLFRSPRAIPTPKESRPRDEGIDAMAESAWRQACRELAHSET